MNYSDHEKSRNVILGTLRNLGTENLRPFFDSLRQTGYDGDVVMFCNNTSKDTLAYLHSKGVTTIPFRYWAIRNHQPLLLFWPLWKRIIALLPGFKAKSFVARRVWFLYTLRFLFYYEFLLAHSEYSRIMLTDVRDVWFQRDPFEWMGDEEELYCFEEAPGRFIGNCPLNSMMVAEALGETSLRSVFDCQISCAGVTFGTRKPMLGYLERICRYAFVTKVFKTCSGVDQGFHNWIVHRDPVAGHKLINNEGPVYTMGLYDKNEIKINNDGYIVNNSNGNIPAVLHQYDRFPMVSKKIHLLLKLNTDEYK